MFRRTLSLFVACAIVLTSIPAMPVAEAATARAASTDVVLSYVKSDEGDKNVATIVRGNSTTIKVEKKSSGFTAADPPFTVDSTDASIGNPSQFIQIKDNLDPSTKDITALETLPMDEEGEGLTFSVTGNFYALLAKGDAYETAGGWGHNALTSVESASPNAIITYSEATIVATKGETLNTLPTFAFQTGADKVGAFADFDSISVKECTQWSSLNGGAGKSKVLTIQLAKGSMVQEYKIYPKQMQTIYEMDTTVTPPVPVEGPDGKPVIKETNNYIAENSTFRLVFRLPTSNSLFLRVLTPKRATMNIADEILRNDGVLNQTYIKLGSADDQLGFITKDFKLNSFINQYSTNFNIEWKWVPRNAADKDAVSISSSGTWRDVAINPRVEDVYGSLIATVYYKKSLGDSGGGREVFTESLPIDILIRGLGEPGAVTQKSQAIYRDSGPVDFPAGETAQPSSKDMDIYDGGVVGFPKPLERPYQYRLLLEMGRRNASAQYATVEVVSGDKDIVTAQSVVGNAASEFTFGGKIENPQKNNVDEIGKVFLDLTAVKKGNVKLQVTFWVKGNNNTIVKALVQPKPITINVYDTSPSNDASLLELVVKDNEKNKIEANFAPGTLSYEIRVPYKTTSFTVTPRKNDIYADKNLQYSYTYVNEAGDVVKKNFTKENGYITEPLDLVPNEARKLEITVTAQNPNVHTTYTISILREPPSDDGRLKVLQLLDDKGTDHMVGYNMDNGTYRVTVPYRTQKLQVVYEKNHDGAQDPIFTSDNSRVKLHVGGWYELRYDDSNPNNIKDTTNLQIKVVPENMVDYDASIYSIDIVRLPPSTDATLTELKVADSADKAVTYTPKFDPTENLYEMSVPYATSRLKFSAKPTNDGATMFLKAPGSSSPVEMLSGRFTPAQEVPYITSGAPYQDFVVVVKAEDTRITKEYTLRVMRAEPENEASLETLKLVDTNKKDLELGFNPESYNYNITVPYEVEKAIAIPTPTSKNATVTVNGRKVESGKESSPIKLEPSLPTQITVEVTAQDGRTVRTYNIRITRATPSSDARLKGLVLTGAEKFKPLFIANKYYYTADVTMGSQGVTFTPTANHPYATITVDGKKVESGKASELIGPIDIKQTVEIVVTAQDGVTTLVYTVDLTNQNLIEKTSNADLRDLTVNFGTMSPKRFQPSVTVYDVAVVEDAASVEIVPTPDDKLATVTVFQGSKEIGDYNDIYAEYIEDGETEFTVKVVSPDLTVTKEYTILVHRNEEDAMGRLNPIMLENVDFTPNVILVDITKFTRVNAEVFNELKKFPDKRIIFQGNDYSLEFKGSDITRNIPHTENIDLAMTFTSPFEEKIWEELDGSNYNDDLRPVFVHFYHEGVLPGQATLSLSLGRRYWDDQLYWHYYNEERERIDYYGYMQTNNRGTFTIPLDHFSTYIITRNHAIRGSDNKTSEVTPNLDNPQTTQGQLTPPAKENPVTGVEGIGGGGGR